MKVIKVDAACYPFSILVITTKKIKKLEKFLKKEKIKIGDQGRANALTIDCGNGKMVIWLKGKVETLEQLSVLNHEIFHVVCFILQDLAIKLDENSEEAYAYLTDYVSLKIYKELGIKISY